VIQVFRGIDTFQLAIVTGDRTLHYRSGFLGESDPIVLSRYSHNSILRAFRKFSTLVVNFGNRIELEG
jgi:hypothetical protein